MLIGGKSRTGNADSAVASEILFHCSAEALSNLVRQYTDVKNTFALENSLHRSTGPEGNLAVLESKLHAEW